mgnify:CR=1 FL=1
MPHDSLEEELAAETIRAEDLKRIGWKNHENSDAEQMRRKLLAHSESEWVWKREIADMQKSVHDSHIRIKDLNEEIYKDLKKNTLFLKNLGEKEMRTFPKLDYLRNITSLQTNKINFLLSTLDKNVADNYTLIEKINGNLDSNINKNLFDIYKNDKIKLNSKTKENPGLIYENNEKRFEFYLKNYEIINKELQRIKELPLGWPVQIKTKITSKYGYRKDPINRKRKFHYGIDISGNLSKKIVSTGDGKVVFAGPKGGYGLTVIVGHRNNYKSSYSHLSKIFVKKDEKLKKGDIIGLMGSTGRSTGVHLHYEIIRKENKINPEKHLEAI